MAVCGMRVLRHACAPRERELLQGMLTSVSAWCFGKGGWSLEAVQPACKQANPYPKACPPLDENGLDAPESMRLYGESFARTMKSLTTPALAKGGCAVWLA